MKNNSKTQNNGQSKQDDFSNLKSNMTKNEGMMNVSKKDKSEVITESTKSLNSKKSQEIGNKSVYKDKSKHINASLCEDQEKISNANISESKVKRDLNRYFSISKAGTKEVTKKIDTKVSIGRVNFKLAQRLDSAGHVDLSKEVAKLPDSSQSWFSRIITTFKAWPLSYKIRVIGGGVAGSVVVFGALMFVLVWYNGANVMLVNQFFNSKPPVLTLNKDSETDYGVVAEGNSFTIETSENIAFNSLGISNKVTIEPNIDFTVSLADDNRSLEIIPNGSLEPDTSYTITLRNGTMFSDGSSLSKDLVWKIQTEPLFIVTGITPKDGSDTAPVDTAIEVEFNYKNIDADNFADYFEIVPPVSGRFEHHDKKIVFLPDSELMKYSEYKVIVKKGFSNEFGDELTQQYESTFMISGIDSSGNYIQQPYMYWADYSPVISMTQDPWIGINSYEFNSNIDVTVYSTEINSFVKSMDDFGWEIIDKPDNLTEIKKLSLSTTDASFFNINVNEYGIYFIEAYNANVGRSIYKYIIYSPIGFIRSDAQDNEKVWVFNMNDKTPINGANVSYYDLDLSLNPVYSGVTNSDGYNSLDTGGIDVVVAEYSGNYSVSTFNSNDMWGWEYSWGGQESNLEYRAAIYTDKPFYKIGDTVKFKGILRKEDDMEYDIPENKDVTVRVGDSFYWWNGLSKLPYYEEEFNVSDNYGTFSGEFKIPVNVEPGRLALDVLVDDKISASRDFEVGYYVKPKYSYEISLDKSYAFTGDTVTVDIWGKDYAGAAASGQSVTFSLYRSEIGDSNWFEDESDFENIQSYYYGGESVSTETVVLGADGHAQRSFVIDSSIFGSKMGIYTAYLWSTSDAMAGSDSESIIVANDSYTIFAKPVDLAIGSGEGNTINFKTSKLWNFEEAGGIRVVYSIKRTWTEWVESGTYYDPVTKSVQPVYRAQSNSEYIATDQEFTTEADGTYNLSLLDLAPGYYDIETTIYKDGVSQRNLEDLFFVYDADSGDHDWYGSNNNIDIYLDQKSYEVGQSADVSIMSTITGKGLFMVKRGDVYSWKIIDLTSGFVKIQEKITDKMSPNVEFCVWGINEYSSGDNEYLGISSEYLTNIFDGSCKYAYVTRDYGKLNVTVTSDKDVYEPGDEVTLDIRVTDDKGKGVESELSIDVVDKAIMDIYRQDKDNLGNDIYGDFYSDVRQWANVNGSVRAYSYAGTFGAGGGGDISDVRTNFADVAYWNPSIETDGAGKAKIKFTLPDNMTTWVANVISVTDDTWVGDSETEFVAKKDVRLDAAVPSYLREGDVLNLDLETANYSTGFFSGQVSVDCNNCETKTYTKDVSRSANTRAFDQFSLDPKDGVNFIDITATLKSDTGTVDTISWNVPIEGDGFINSLTQSTLLGDKEFTGEVNFDIPDEVDLNTATIEMSFARSFVNEYALNAIDPSIASSVELSNSIIHNATICKYYDQIQPIQSKALYEEKVKDAFDLLQTNQGSDGGFGWFDYDAENYELSSHVGVALGLAMDCGVVKEDDTVVNNLNAYLMDGVYDDNLSMSERVYAIYALSMMKDESVLPYAVSLKNNVDLIKDSPLDIAHLMLALEQLGDYGDAGELIPALEALANTSDRAATWEDLDSPLTITKSMDYTTAVAYLALSGFDQSDDKDLARTWLIENPVLTNGSSTEATAIFYSLTVSSLQNLVGRQGVDKVSIRVNGKDVRTFDVDGTDDWIGKVNLTIDSSYLENGENTIEIDRSGKGELYSIANLVYYSNDLPGDPEFYVNRDILDYNSGTVVDSVVKGQVVYVKTSVTVDRDGYNLVVNNFIPAGFEPVQYTIGSFDYNFMKRFWNWGNNDDVNRYGDVFNDKVTFSEYKVQDGQTYVFEFPLVATYSGEFSGAGSQCYLQGFEDIDGYDVSKDIEVE